MRWNVSNVLTTFSRKIGNAQYQKHILQNNQLSICLNVFVSFLELTMM